MSGAETFRAIRHSLSWVQAELEAIQRSKDMKLYLIYLQLTYRIVYTLECFLLCYTFMQMFETLFLISWTTLCFLFCHTYLKSYVSYEASKTANSKDTEA